MASSMNGVNDPRSSPLYVELQADGSILVSGEIDIGTVEQLRHKIAEVIEPNRAVVLDMAQVIFLASSGIEALADVYSATGERVVIRNPSRRVRRALRLVDNRAKPVAWVIEET